MISCKSVQEFVALGQPELVPTGPSAPSLTSYERLLIATAVDEMHGCSEVLKSVGSTATALGARLMLEELGETLDAMRKGDLVELADGLADLVYVALWTAVVHGIPLDDVFAEVHRANMMKFPLCDACEGTGCGPVLSRDSQGRALTRSAEMCSTCAGKGRLALRDANGKVQKPPGWTLPDIAGVLSRAEQAAKLKQRWSMPESVRQLAAMPRQERMAAIERGRLEASTGASRKGWRELAADVVANQATQGPRAAYVDCINCLDTKLVPALPWESPLWGQAAFEVFCEAYNSALPENKRLMRAMVKTCAVFVGLPEETLWRLGGKQVHPTEGGVYDPPEVLALNFVREAPFGRAKDARPFRDLRLSDVVHVQKGLLPFLARYGQPRTPCPACASTSMASVGPAATFEDGVNPDALTGDQVADALRAVVELGQGAGEPK